MLTTIIAAIALGPGAPVLVLKGCDPIELIRGKEIVGKEELIADFGMHRYRFASEQNLRTFKKRPVEYAVQMGGACGRMGALSGKGNPDRWAVVRGKIFLFASDDCRDTFLRSQEVYFKTLPVLAQPTKPQKREAELRFRQALMAHGGDHVRKMNTVEWLVAIPYSRDGKDLVWKTNYGVYGKSKAAKWSEWADGIRAYVVDGRRAFEGNHKDVFAIHPAERREVIAQSLRNPAAILIQDQSTAQFADKNNLGFLMRVEDLVLRVNCDESTKRIKTISFTDQFNGPICNVEMEFGDYEEMSGIWLPKTYRVRTDGGEFGMPISIASYAINAPLPEVFSLR